MRQRQLKPFPMEDKGPLVLHINAPQTMIIVNTVAGDDTRSQG